MRLDWTLARGDVAGTLAGGVVVITGAWLCVVHWVVATRIVLCNVKSMSVSVVRRAGVDVDVAEWEQAGGSRRGNAWMWAWAAPRRASHSKSGEAPVEPEDDPA